MGYVIVALLVGLPLFELWLLVEVGTEIGGIEVILLSIFTAAAGIMLVRAQGLQLLMDLQREQAAGRALGKALVHGFFLLIAGALLLVPGLLTDTVGILLLIPPVRTLLGFIGLAGFFVRHASVRGFQGRRSGSDHSRTQRTTVIIDGEIVDPAHPQGTNRSPHPPGTDPNQNQQ